MTNPKIYAILSTIINLKGQVPMACGITMSTENISILDQIINSKKADEVGSLDAVEIINNSFIYLMCIILQFLF